MLVLSRKMMESVYIFIPDDSGGRKVKIQVVGTGKLIRLGIEADRDVTILREELIDSFGSSQLPSSQVVAACESTTPNIKDLDCYGRFPNL